MAIKPTHVSSRYHMPVNIVPGFAGMKLTSKHRIESEERSEIVARGQPDRVKCDKNLPSEDDGSGRVG